MRLLLETQGEATAEVSLLSRPLSIRWDAGATLPLSDIDLSLPTLTWGAAGRSASQSLWWAVSPSLACHCPSSPRKAAQHVHPPLGPCAGSAEDQRRPLPAMGRFVPEQELCRVPTSGQGSSPCWAQSLNQA